MLLEWSFILALFVASKSNLPAAQVAATLHCSALNDLFVTLNP